AEIPDVVAHVPDARKRPRPVEPQRHALPETVRVANRFVVEPPIVVAADARPCREPFRHWIKLRHPRKSPLVRPAKVYGRLRPLTPAEAPAGSTQPPRGAGRGP